MNTGAAVAHLLESESAAPVATQENVARVTAIVDGNAGRLVQLMTEYASIAAQRHQTAKLALLLANFQKFVVLSACVVLKANGAAPVNEVFAVRTDGMDEPQNWFYTVCKPSRFLPLAISD
ncbi:hypothetical protein LTR56_025883 [Elasticomyces elasticus]|nr:hypothetical protein LTR56_025883 [Elasticomyces elasticus]KAK5738852.1 hypothetical protein LTS12_025474 [Elasticomyces elasticus]